MTSEGWSGACFAPVLPAEGWISIDRYYEDYLQFGSQYFPDRQVKNLLSTPRADLKGWQRRIERDLVYPQHVKKFYRSLGKSGEKIPLHIFDHSYSHLVRTAPKTILHCRDLNHLVAPSLTGLALMRWKQRISLMKQADVVIAISHQLKEEIKEHLAIPEERLRVIHHGVDLKRFCPDLQKQARRQFPKLAESAKESFLILNVGTNLPRKNLETIYAGMALLKEEGMKVKLVRVGLNGSREDEDDRIRKAGIEDDVIQLGKLDAVGVALVCNLCHVLAFSSVYEGFGRPLLESQACGLPLVAAKASCLPEIAGEGAWYHDPHSSEDWATQIKRVSRNDSNVQNLITAGLANAEKYSWETHLEKIFAVYDEFR